MYYLQRDGPLFHLGWWSLLTSFLHFGLLHLDSDALCVVRYCCAVRGGFLSGGFLGLGGCRCITAGTAPRSWTLMKELIVHNCLCECPIISYVIFMWLCVTLANSKSSPLMRDNTLQCIVYEHAQLECQCSI